MLLIRRWTTTKRERLVLARGAEKRRDASESTSCGLFAEMKNSSNHFSRADIPLCFHIITVLEINVVFIK